MKGQILILDDNPVDLKIASGTMEAAGFACYAFLQPAEALAWCASNVPQVIFLDLQLEQTSGFEMIAKFKAIANSSQVPILILSGRNHVEDVRKAIALGAVDYVVKPADPLVVQEKVSRLLRRGESEFHSVDLPGGPKSAGAFCQPFEITAISEFGFRVKSALPLKPGQTIEAASLATEVFGTAKLFVRCLTTEQQSDKTYAMQFTFVGMVEAQRQVIRKFCRQIWTLSRRKYT